MIKFFLCAALSPSGDWWWHGNLRPIRCRERLRCLRKYFHIKQKPSEIKCIQPCHNVLLAFHPSPSHPRLLKQLHNKKRTRVKLKNHQILIFFSAVALRAQVFIIERWMKAEMYCGCCHDEKSAPFTGMNKNVGKYFCSHKKNKHRKVSHLSRGIKNPTATTGAIEKNPFRVGGAQRRFH